MGITYTYRKLIFAHLFHNDTSHFKNQYETFVPSSYTVKKVENICDAIMGVGIGTLEKDTGQIGGNKKNQ